MTTTQYQSIIDTYYPAGTRLRDIYMNHCRQVSDLALRLNSRSATPLDPLDVEAAAMLHDIGICRCHAPSIACLGTEPYICHGVIGAAMLLDLGVAPAIALVAERHTGSGLTAAEIADAGLPLPLRDLLPVSPLERLVCYADKFFSKSGDGHIKPLERVRREMAAHGAASLARFDKLVEEFGTEIQK